MFAGHQGRRHIDYLGYEPRVPSEHPALLWQRYHRTKLPAALAFFSGRRLVPMLTAVAGIAWAQTVGIAKVEVRVDEGEWQEARLGTDVSDDSWRQWVLDWDAPAAPTGTGPCASNPARATAAAP